MRPLQGGHQEWLATGASQLFEFREVLLAPIRVARLFVHRRAPSFAAKSPRVSPVAGRTPVR